MEAYFCFRKPLRLQSLANVLEYAAEPTRRNLFRKYASFAWGDGVSLVVCAASNCKAQSGQLRGVDLVRRRKRDFAQGHVSYHRAGADRIADTSTNWDRERFILTRVSYHRLWSPYNSSHHRARSRLGIHFGASLEEDRRLKYLRSKRCFAFRPKVHLLQLSFQTQSFPKCRSEAEDRLVVQCFFFNQIGTELTTIRLRIKSTPGAPLPEFRA
jgi:hypothetical protein